MSYSHQPKSIISLKDFRIGTRTYGDTEREDAQGKWGAIQNLEVDKPGMLYKRDPAKYLATKNGTISQIKKWFNTNLTGESWNGENYESCWLAFSVDGANDKIRIYNALDFALEATLATPGSAGGTCQIIPFNHAVRFANGQARNASIWLYNYNTEFFHGLYTSAYLIADSRDGFNYGNAHLGYPDSWAFGSLAVSNYGNLPNGYYHYKITGVYDGVQEMELSDVIFTEVYTDNKKGSTITFDFSMDIDDFDPRIKSLKIYRGYAPQNIDVVYNHIASIELASDTGDIGTTKALNTMWGTDHADRVALLDPTKDFSGAEFNKSTYPDDSAPYTEGEHRYFLQCHFTNLSGRIRRINIISNFDGFLVLEEVGGITDNDRLWLGNYSIEVIGEYWSVSNNRWIRDDDPAHTFQLYSNDMGCIGDNVLWDVGGDDADGGAEYRNNRFTNWQYDISGGNSVVILTNYGNLFLLDGGHGIVSPANISGTATQNQVSFSLADRTGTPLSGTITLEFTDTGYPDGAEHPLAGITKTKMNYVYGALHNGRLFMLDIALDPDDENEIHENWLGYTEYNQYDTAPVTNVIPVVDTRGGKGTGVISTGGYLMVFTETGVFRVYVPGVDPSGWNIEQGIDSMGSTAPDSITSAEGLVIFANASGIHAVVPGDFTLYELTYDVKDQYLASSNLENTRVTYDPHKRRLVCKFGDTVTTQHVLDLEQFLANGKTAWTTQLFDDTASNRYAPSLLAIDENLKLYGFNHFDNVGTPSTGFSQIYGTADGAETLACIITSPWISVKNIDYNAIWRRLQLVMKQFADATNGDLENITINIYVDKSDSLAKTFTFSANAEDYTSLSITEEMYRLSLRSTFMKFTITTTKTNSSDFEIHRIEATIDD